MFRLQKVQREQFFRGGTGQLFVLLGGELLHPVSRLAGNGHAHTAGGDHLPHFFQQHSCAVQIYLQDGLDGLLTGRNAGGVDQHGDLTPLLGFGDHASDRLPRGQIQLHGQGVKACRLQNIGHLLRMFGILVTHKDLSAVSHPPGNGHADLACARQQHYLFHIWFLSVLFESGSYRTHGLLLTALL